MAYFWVSSEVLCWNLADQRVFPFSVEKAGGGGGAIFDGMEGI